ncbi:hypothetical protein KIN20_008417 [Parelaphostrongylus tenuis]|uniref:Uncharacterized protein n=1 Tax=Parelaphostrongylus tenuis TaxID=148309 RepID=A0AAD5QMP8_PARTN|nr:hypothetical protein KIN20_008417 [Parelaphostrongylus tenuis]
MNRTLLALRMLCELLHVDVTFVFDDVDDELIIAVHKSNDAAQISYILIVGIMMTSGVEGGVDGERNVIRITAT